MSELNSGTDTVEPADQLWGSVVGPPTADELGPLESAARGGGPGDAPWFWRERRLPLRGSSAAVPESARNGTGVPRSAPRSASPLARPARTTSARSPTPPPNPGAAARDPAHSSTTVPVPETTGSATPCALRRTPSNLNPQLPCRRRALSPIFRGASGSGRGLSLATRRTVVPVRCTIGVVCRCPVDRGPTSAPTLTGDSDAGGPVDFLTARSGTIPWWLRPRQVPVVRKELDDHGPGQPASTAGCGQQQRPPPRQPCDPAIGASIQQRTDPHRVGVNQVLGVGLEVLRQDDLPPPLTHQDQMGRAAELKVSSGVSPPKVSLSLWLPTAAAVRRSSRSRNMVNTSRGKSWVRR